MDKSKIHLAACEKLNHKIFFLEKIIHETRTSNQETKSSMGDKYETSREMIQQEIHHLQLQLNENFRYLKIIKKIQTNHHYKVQLGSLVQSENIFFYISVSLGHLYYNNQKIYIISPESPIAKEMMGKHIHNFFIFNKQKQIINNIW